MSFTPVCPGTYGAGPLLIERPVVKPWGFGLVSVATVIDETNEHARNGIVYKSPPCTADVQPWVDSCIPADLLDKIPTDADRNAIVRGCPFHLYAALGCKTTTLAAMTEEVRAVFDLGEQRAVEEQVWVKVLAQAGSTVLNASSATTDAFTVTGGIAALESAIAACYGGEATLWGDRGLATYAARERVILQQAGHLETIIGSKFGFLGGSPNTSPAGVPAPSGFAWIYITSDLTLRRFPVNILPDDVNQRLRYNPLTNEPYVVAERSYVPSIECCAYAALVCLSC